MLSIGEFSAICKVSAKTLRYYAEIGLIHPEEINPESGYRYYSIRQLETMLFINRLKSYSFSLDEIKSILHSEELTEEILYPALIRKEREMEKQILEYQKTLEQMNQDIANLKQGRSIMSYLDTIEIQLAELPQMYLLSVRKMVQENDFPEEYEKCYGKLFKKMLEDKLTAAAPSCMVPTPRCPLYTQNSGDGQKRRATRETARSVKCTSRIPPRYHQKMNSSRKFIILSRKRQQKHRRHPDQTQRRTRYESGKDFRTGKYHMQGLQQYNRHPCSEKRQDTI